MSNQECLDDQDEFYDANIWGQPGVGKGAIIKALYPNVLELKVSVIDIADINGLPNVPHKGELYEPLR